jgi:integrase/recombinase XerD
MGTAIERAKGPAELAAPGGWSDEDELLITRWVGKHPRSGEQYRREIDWFGAWAGWKPLRTVTLNDLELYAEYLHTATARHQTAAARRSGATAKPLGVGTIAKKLATLKSLCTFGNKVGLLPFNVGAGVALPARQDRLSQRILTEEQVHSIIENEPVPRRRMLWRLFYFSGGRISEVVALRWDECHPQKGGGGVIDFTNAKGGRIRSVRLRREVWNDLMGFRSADSNPYVFPSVRSAVRGRPREGDHHVDPATAWRWFKAACDRAGVVAPGRKVLASPHWLRHAHASHALEHDEKLHVVQATLGHANLATTSRYVHVRPGASSGDSLAMDRGERGNLHQLELGGLAGEPGPGRRRAPGDDD